MKQWCKPKKIENIKAHTNKQGEKRDRETVGKTEQKTKLAENELHNKNFLWKMSNAVVSSQVCLNKPV